MNVDPAAVRSPENPRRSGKSRIDAPDESADERVEFVRTLKI
jgi:hypothetical protein